MDDRLFMGIFQTMNQYEKSVLRIFKTKICDSVDPVTLVSFLFRHGNVPKELKERVMFLFRTGNSRNDIIEVVLDTLPEVINIPNLVYALYSTGYREIAAELFFQTRTPANEIYRHRSSSSEDRTRLQTLYRNLKRMVHDSQFKNPREALRSMAKRFRSDFEVERDELRRQKLADKCVAILGVELDAHYYSALSTDEITQQEILYEMVELIPKTTNPLITDTIVYSRQANLDACHGDFNDAESMLKTARGSAQSVQQCLELVNLLYVEVYVKLWQFETTPSREVLDALMMWGRFGLECLKNEHEETRRMWKRMFILRMVFGLLGLGNRGNLIQGYTVDRASIKEAQNLLADVDKTWDSIEIRREMLYCIARARLNEALQLFDNAMEYLERAKSLAVQGGFLEKPLIEDFMKTVESKLTQDCSALSEISSSLNGDTVHEDTKPKAPLNGEISLKLVDNAENKVKEVDLQQEFISWKPKTTPHSQVMVYFGDLHNGRERQLQELEKRKEEEEEQNHDNAMMKCRGEMVRNHYEDEWTNRRGCENTKETCQEASQGRSSTSLEELNKQAKVDVVKTWAPGQILELRDVERIHDIPESVFGTSLANDHLRMKSTQTNRFPTLIKKKIFEGESDHDLAMPESSDPDNTDLKAVIGNHQYSDSEYLRKIGHEPEASSEMLYSSSVVQLDNEKDHTEEENTSPKLVVYSLPGFPDGINRCFRVENGGPEDVSVQRAKVRLQLVEACREKVEFGSVALYEDRLEPEGASYISD